MVEQNMKKYNEDEVNYSTMCKLRQYLVELGNYEIDVGSIEGKQLDLCKSNIIFCHVDCFCLQGEKED